MQDLVRSGQTTARAQALPQDGSQQNDPSSATGNGENTPTHLIHKQATEIQLVLWPTCVMQMQCGQEHMSVNFLVPWINCCLKPPTLLETVCVFASCTDHTSPHLLPPEHRALVLLLWLSSSRDWQTSSLARSALLPCCGPP